LGSGGVLTPSTLYTVTAKRAMLAKQY
jgi:hypothetical protein